MKPKDLIGSIIGTDLGPVKIKKAGYLGFLADQKGSLTKVVKVVGVCGIEFNSTLEDLAEAVEDFKARQAASKGAE